MAQLLAYSTTAPDVSPVIRWEIGGVGEASSARVVIPPPPTWSEALGLALVVLALAAVLAVFAAAFAHAVRWSTPPDALTVALSAGTLAVVGRLLYLAIRGLVRLPRTARVPTVISAARSGLLITTMRTGAAEQFYFPPEQLAAVSATRGPRTLTGLRTVEVLVADGDGEVHAFRFLTRDRDAAGRLDSVLRAALDRPAVAARDGFFYPGPTPI